MQIKSKKFNSKWQSRIGIGIGADDDNRNRNRNRNRIDKKQFQSWKKRRRRRKKIEQNPSEIVSKNKNILNDPNVQYRSLRKQRKH